MDGTLYLGEQLYSVTSELLDTLRKRGKKCLFMTNDSSKSVDDYVKNLQKWESLPRGRILDGLLSEEILSRLRQLLHLHQKRIRQGAGGHRQALGVAQEKVCVVGDRVYTDIKSGLNAGVTAVLVLSGETTPEILQQSADKPHLVLKDAGEIPAALKV